MIVTDAGIGDIEAIESFFNKVVRSDYPTVRENYFQWQFVETDRIFGKEDNKGAIMLMDRDEVKGVALASKTPFFFHNETLVGGCHHEWFVEPELIGRGFGYQLLQELLERNSIILAGGQSLYYTNLMGRSRKTHWFETPRLYTVLNVTDAEKLLLSSGPPTKSYLELCSKVPDHNVLSSKRMACFDETYDQFWLDARDAYLIAINKTASYMNWRYIKHPVFHYDCWCYETVAGLAYFVWRCEKVQGTSLSVTRICEAIGNPTSISLAYPTACNQIKAMGATIVDFFCTCAQTNMALAESGMHYVITQPDFNLPRLYSPLSDDPRKSINWSLSISDELFKMDHRNYSQCYFTKGDSNQDRPNI